MRILLVTNYMPPHLGGVEYAGQALKECWEADGHQVTWLTTDIPPNGSISDPGIVRVPAFNFLESWFDMNTPIIRPQAWPTLLRLVRTHDVINTHSLAPGLSLAVLHAALRRRKPAVATQHVSVIALKSRLATRLQMTLMPSLARWSVRHGALLTFVSPAVREWFIARTGLPETRFRLTPAGIDQSQFFYVTDAERTHCQLKWALPEDRLKVLFVGRFIEKKGLPLLRQIATVCPHIHFTFLGSGPLDPAGWNLPNVKVMAHVTTPELRQLYGAHDLFIMPSYGEGWPAVIPQAMACGLACLISTEAFEGHGQDPDLFVIRHREAKALILTLEEAAKGRLPLANQRDKIADYAKQQWDWRKTARTYLALFEEQQQGVADRQGKW